MNRKERRAAQKRAQAAGARVNVQGASVTPAQVAELLVQVAHHRQRGELAEAQAILQRILAVLPNHAESLFALGGIAMQARRPDAAVHWIAKAISANNRNAAFHNEMGIALQALGRAGEAVDCFHRAVKLDPANGRMLNNLAVALHASGRLEEASAVFARTLEHSPELFEQYGNVSATLLALNPAIRQAVQRLASAWPRRLELGELFEAGQFAAMAGDPLLNFMLASSTTRDIALERLLTNVRAALLKSSEDRNKPGDKRDLDFRCALARQCYLNEYIFPTTAEELATVERSRDELGTALAEPAAVNVSKLAAVASYMPLAAIPNARKLVDSAVSSSLPNAVRALVTQQLLEPDQERDLAAAIPQLTEIVDETSVRVRAQYEENPYPRWVLGPSKSAPVSINDYLAQKFPAANWRRMDKSSNLDVLVAGCGTGWHSILIAGLFEGARVLAIDLSRASLAFALRKSRELQAGNISYAQADILNLESTGRSFDVVDAGGVLHHLADPIAGWRALCSLVRPGGFMRIGLYSELARRDVIAARAFVTAHEFQSNADGIRAARQVLLQSEHQNLVRWSDFFSTSECRDLLFHVQERRFTLTQIRSFLSEQNLHFIGFDLPDATLAAYRREFPNDPTCTNLDAWEAFERSHPDAFAAMYQFWTQRG